MRFNKKSLGAAFLLAAALGVGAGVALNTDTIYPPESGKAFLQDKGYTVIGGGDYQWFNSCGKNVYAREFKVQDKDGKIFDKTVCYGPGFRYSPLFGS